LLNPPAFIFVLYFKIAAKKTNDDKSLELNYPSALIKQAKLSRPLKYGKFDLQLTIDPRMSWNLIPGLNQTDISKRDLEAYAARAIMNGLGLQSELGPFQFGNDPDDIDEEIVDLLLPNIEYADGSFGLWRFSVFDSMLYGRTAIADIAKRLMSFKGPKTKNRYVFMNAMMSNAGVIQAGAEINRMMLNDKIQLKLPGGDSILIHHYRSPNYTPVRYFANVLCNGPEFLMTPNIWPGNTLNSEMKTLNVSNILGPRTLKMLESMGYATVNNPQQLELEVLDI
jgi:hypothetical protein